MQKTLVKFNLSDSLNADQTPKNTASIAEIQSKLYVALQTSLDLPTLLDIFKTYAQKHVIFESLSLANLKEKIHIDLGEECRHISTYAIQAHDKSVGDLKFSRHEPFNETEKACLKKLLRPLAFPLHHAVEYKRAVHSSLTDPLTQLGNRAAMEMVLENSWSTASRYNQSLSVLLIDLDHFKKTNDQYGHLVGDQVLKSVAMRIKETIRGSDQGFRFGGEEFLVLLPNTDMLGAFIIAERIRDQIDKVPCLCNRQKIYTSASVGLGSVQEGETFQALLDRTDRALYRAKTSGRNCVCSG